MLQKLAAALSHVTIRLSWRALGTPRAIAIAVLLAIATFATLHTLRPPPPATNPIVVASKDLTPGTILTSQHLKTVAVPKALAPQEVFAKPEAVLGETLATAVPAGLFLTPSALVGPGLYSAVPPGTVATPVRFSEPEISQLLSPGDRITVFLTRSDPTGNPNTEVISDRALVLTTTDRAESAGGLLGAAPATTGDMVLLAVPESESAALAAASQMGELSIALVE